MTLAPREIIEAPAREWQRYPEYRDSGVEWLGDVPAHWEIKRLKYGVGMNPDVLTESTDPDLTLSYVDIGNIDSTGNVLGAEELRFEDAPSRARRRVRGGDTIISTVRTYLRAIAFIADPPENMIVSTGFAVLRPEAEIDPKFLFRVVQSTQFVETVVSHSEGVSYPAITPTLLADLPVWIPSLPEQRAIAAFLDRETRKIGDLIARRERLIELLEEKRTALISRAVTKGIDPGVPMKDSGVEWLGEIPEHWKVGPLKYETRFINGAAFKPSDWSDEGIPIIGIENLNGGGNFNHTSREVDSRYHIHEEDLLFAWSGNRGTSFGPFVWRGEGLYYLNQHIFRLSNFQCERSWFYWVLKGVTTYVEKQAHGIIGLVHITKQELGIVKIPLIPRYEQQAIAEHLDREMEKIDALAGKLREHIEKLLEYRTALISAAVTGRIDVREEASAPADCEPDKMTG